MSDSRAGMRAVGFGRNTVFKRCRLQRGNESRVGIFLSRAQDNAGVLSSPADSKSDSSFLIKVNKANVSLCVSCVKNSRGSRRCWCTRVHVDDPERGNTPPHPHPTPSTVPSAHPGEKLRSVTAANTRWLSKEGQVVVPSAAQSSVDAAHADICLPPTAAGRGKICFSICLRSSQPSPPPTAPPTLFCTPAPLFLQS